MHLTPDAHTYYYYVCGGSPPRWHEAVVKHDGLIQLWSPAAAEAASLVACVKLTLSYGVFLVSGTSFPTQLLLLFLFIRMSPCLVSFCLFPPVNPAKIIPQSPGELFWLDQAFTRIFCWWSIIHRKNAFCCYDAQTTTFSTTNVFSKTLCNRKARPAARLCALGKYLHITLHYREAQGATLGPENTLELKYLIHYWGSSNSHIMDSSQLMLTVHEGTALKHPTLRGPCFHHKVKGKWYLKIPLDA